MTSGVAFAKQGVVLVSVNYRVGRFGFFAFPALTSERPDETKGNYAYMDRLRRCSGSSRTSRRSAAIPTM
jgi:para-nitrobenzyl esterase